VHVVLPAPGNKRTQLVTRDREEVALDDAGELEEPLDAVAPHEVVEGEGEAGLAQPAAPVDDLVVDLDGLEDLHDGALRRQGHRRLTHQHAALGVAEDPPRPDQPVDPDRQGAGQHLSGHVLAVVGRRVAGPVEQLEGDDRA
jgi:hypothetical protein